MSMFLRDLRRSGRLNRPKTPEGQTPSFAITSGPTISNITETSFKVTWYLNAVCSGQIQYGTTASYGSTTTEQNISGGYSYHIQTVSNLQSGTTYHFRVKSTNAANTTVYSSDFTVTTSSSSVTTVGPRYGKSTWPYRTNTVWPTIPSGTNVVVVDSTVPTDDPNVVCDVELSDFLNNKTKVPNGSIVVFDKTNGGAGTTYYLDNPVLIDRGAGYLTTDLTLWGYNSVVYNKRKTGTPRTTTYSSRIGTARGAVILYFYDGGYQNLTIKGFELKGGNTNAGTWNCRSGVSEQGHGIEITAYMGMLVQDVYMWNLCGEGFQGRQWDATEAKYYPPITNGTSSGLKIYNTHVNGTGRQGIVVNQCDNCEIAYSIVENTALACFDNEDAKSALARQDNFWFHHNLFKNWHWNLPDNPTKGSNVWEPLCIMETLNDGEGISPQTNWLIENNSFEGGCMGWGNRDAEYAKLGYYSSTESRQRIIVFVGTKARKDVTIRNNVVQNIPAVQLTNLPYADWRYSMAISEAGEFVDLREIENVTVYGNTGSADWGQGAYLYHCSGTLSVTDIPGEVVIDSGTTVTVDGTPTTRHSP